MAETMRDYELSEDGTMISITLGRAVLTLPVESLPTVHMQIGKVIEALQMNDLLDKRPNPPARNLSHYRIGGNPSMPSITAIVFSDGQAEDLWLMKDMVALSIADAIQQKVFQAMPLHDQKKLLKDVEDARGSGGKVILPGSAKR